MRWWVLLFVIFLFFIPVFLFFWSHNKPVSKENVTVQAPSVSVSQRPDLSYIEITADKTATIAAINQANQIVGSFLVQQGIRPPNLPSTQSGQMTDIATYYVQKPQNGKYTVTVISKNTGEIGFYLYDRNASVSMQKFQQSAGKTIYTISFDKDGHSVVAK